MSDISQRIEDWFSGCDTRGVAHRSLVRDWMPGQSDFLGQIDNFAYGDTPLPIMEECLDWCGSFEHFVDLGCGCGKATLLAAARGARAVGYDLLPGVIEVACRASRDLEIPAEFRIGDVAEAELMGVDLVYIAATRFDEALAARLDEKLLELGSGARVLSVSRPFLRVKETRVRTFRWGEGEVACEYQLYLSER